LPGCSLGVPPSLHHPFHSALPPCDPILSTTGNSHACPLSLWQENRQLHTTGKVLVGSQCQNRGQCHRCRRSKFLNWPPFGQFADAGRREDSSGRQMREPGGDAVARDGSRQQWHQSFLAAGWPFSPLSGKAGGAQPLVIACGVGLHRDGSAVRGETPTPSRTRGGNFQA
jgi:hypothetical protein